MIAFPAGMNVWIAGSVTDMRCGMNSLALKVRQGLGRDPHDGEIFCFRGHKGARPKQFAAYADVPDLVQVAAHYTADVVKKHPSVDGNKRTGCLLGILFLELSGYVSG